MTEFLNLISLNKVKTKQITTHTFSIDDAEKAYNIISERSEYYLGILLRYEELTEENKLSFFDKVKISAADAGAKTVKSGFIGVGGHAQSFLLPNIEDGESKLLAICDSLGSMAKHIAEKYNVQFCTSNPDDVINDDNINTIFVATRHNSHGQLVLNSILKNKNIFVEKPLAMNQDELNKIIVAYQEKLKENKAPAVFVGYNRRFAPLMKEIKKHFKDIKDPLVVNYRINAGYLPANHWTQDPIEGGGRIIGEVCHFIDIVQFLTNSKPVSVFAQSIKTTNDKIISNDNINITINMENGSLGIITYLANGDKGVGKERIEVTGGNYYGILENFETAYLYKNEKKTIIKGQGLDKGHKNEVKEFIESIKNKRTLIDFESQVLTSLTSFKILESLRTNELVNIV